MKNSEKPHFAAKHPAGAKPAERVARAIANRAPDGHLSCAEGTALAAELGVEMRDVGTAADLMEIRIIRCDLGLFGMPTKKVKRPPESLPAPSPELEAAIDQALVKGRLPCAAAWEIAAKLNLPRQEIARACDALKIKISPCQLGAFKQGR